jgi:hypothetical protein
VLEGWIPEGCIEATNIGSQKRPYYQIYLPSVVRFYERRLVGGAGGEEGRARRGGAA